MITSPNTHDTPEGGSAAASKEPQIKYDLGTKINSADSILGGSAATNFPVTPNYKAPMGGTKEHTQGAVGTGGTYTVESKTSTGSETNDHAK